MAAARYLLGLFLAAYLTPLLVVAAATWTSMVSFTAAWHSVELLGVQFTGSFVIPFLTLFSAQDAPNGASRWVREILVLVTVFVTLAILSGLLAVNWATHHGRILAELDQVAYDHVFSALQRYTTETISYAALVAGIRLTLPIPKNSGANVTL